MEADHPVGRPDDDGRAGFDAGPSDPEAQAEQFGYNCDYLDIIVTNREGTAALLVANHEYTNENIMFPPGNDPADGDPHGLGGARDVAWSSSSAARAGGRGSTSKRGTATDGSRWIRRSRSTARPPGPRCCGPRRTRPAAGCGAR